MNIYLLLLSVIDDMVHPENIVMAERVSRIIGLDVAGIDIMAENLTERARAPAI